MVKITREHYAALYGPTTGDAVRLGDSSLLAEIEHDYAVPGDECLHGGGKTLRDGIGLVAGLDSAAERNPVLYRYRSDAEDGP